MQKKSSIIIQNSLAPFLYSRGKHKHHPVCLFISMDPICVKAGKLSGVILCKMEGFLFFCSVFFLFLLYWHTNNTLPLLRNSFDKWVQRIGRELSPTIQSHLKNNISRTNELWNSVIIYNYSAKKCKCFKYLKHISTKKIHEIILTLTKVKYSHTLSDAELWW